MYFTEWRDNLIEIDQAIKMVVYWGISNKMSANGEYESLIDFTYKSFEKEYNISEDEAGKRFDIVKVEELIDSIIESEIEFGLQNYLTDFKKIKINKKDLRESILNVDTSNITKNYKENWEEIKRIDGNYDSFFEEKNKEDE